MEVTISADDLGALTNHLGLDRHSAPTYDPKSSTATFRDDVSDAVSAALADPIWRSAAAAQRLASYAAARRRSVVAGGCVVAVSGVDVPCWADSGTQSAITALVVAAQINPALVTRWKGRDGLFYELNTADVGELAAGLMAFVQDAFSTEAAVVAAIDAGTITTTDEIDNAEWPSNGDPA